MAKRYLIAEQWNHRFSNHDNRTCRFIFDRRSDKMACLEIRRRSQWVAADAELSAEIENSLRAGQLQVVAGLEESNRLPEWAAPYVTSTRIQATVGRLPA
jgi:hypothetical protein